MNKYFLYFISFVYSFTTFFTLSGMDFVKKDSFLFRDILMIPRYNDIPENLKYRVDAYTITGLDKGVRVGKYLDLWHSTGQNRYLLKVLPSISVKLYKNIKNILTIEKMALIDAVGLTVSLEKDCPQTIFVEYVLIEYKDVVEKNSYMIEVFEPGEPGYGKKPVFKKRFAQKVLFYKTYLMDDREFITFSFGDHIQLYDLKSGEKITEIKTDEAVRSCYIGYNGTYLIVSANNKVKVINLEDKDKAVLTKTCEDVIISAGSMLRYVALVTLSKANENKKMITLIDLDRNNKQLEKLSLNSAGYYYGFGKGWRKKYFWLMSHDADVLGIFNLNPFKKILVTNFKKNKKNNNKKRIKSFSVEEYGGHDHGRDIAILFDDGTKECLRRWLQ